MRNKLLNGIPIYQAEIFDESAVSHAIFTRLGGVSPAPYDSLNISATVGDEPANVHTNLATVYRAMGVRDTHVVTAHQVHGNRVARVGQADGGSFIPECDGLVTNERGVFLLMRFADCAALMVYDPVRHVIGLAHAGWQGTLLRVAEALVKAMRSAYGSIPSDLVALIGPSIGPCCLEVGPEVVARAYASLADGQWVVSRLNAAGHAYLDIWQANRSQLERFGISNIETTGICTRCAQHEFFSHRGSGGITGRFGVIIGLR